MTFLKFLMLLTLSLWLGGIMFFSAVEAPLVLSHVHDRAAGGEIISQSLVKLHWLGMICGLVFLLASLIHTYVTTADRKLLTLSRVLAILMLALTAISQHWILPAIAELRAAQAEPATAARFQHLHSSSVGLEGTVLFLGLLLLYLQSGDSGVRK